MNVGFGPKKKAWRKDVTESDADTHPENETKDFATAEEDDAVEDNEDENDKLETEVKTESDSDKSKRRLRKRNRKKEAQGEKNVACDLCSEMFFSARGLYNHQSRVHKIKVDFSCHQCGKQFKDNYKLTRHQRVHSITR